jgi:cysteine desulfurase/selenocysteine lyase
VTPDHYELRADARRFESWERNEAACAGMGAAVAYARSWGLDAIGERVAAVADGLRASLGGVPGVTVRDLGRRRCGIVTFTHDAVPAEDIAVVARAAGINVSVSHPSSTRLDADNRGLPPLVRASVHYLTTDDELDALTRLVADLPA